MQLPDVNVLVYAFRTDTPDHERYRTWLTGLVNDESAFACSDHVLSGFLRVVTHPRVFVNPDPISDALKFAIALREAPNCVRVGPGPGHWAIFQRLCTEARAKGSLVPDAYLAAIAIESGCEWITADHDFSRFRGLRWRHPLAD